MRTGTVFTGSGGDADLRTLAELPDRFDAWNMDAFVDGDSTSLFFQRVTCSTPLGYEIYRLDV